MKRSGDVIFLRAIVPQVMTEYDARHYRKRVSPAKVEAYE